MNIIAISMVKNEEDIIELFCRYTLGFCDKMLVIEDNSDDRTPEILLSLVGEGLPIEIIRNDFSSGFYTYEKTNKLAEDAFKIHGADLVIPLDADEFITTDTGMPVRSILEGLRNDCEYIFSWRTYVFTERVLNKEGNLFERFDNYRPAELETYEKTIVSRELFVNDQYRIKQGKHGLHPLPGSPQCEKVVSADLVFAHYPIRSIGQANSKIIIGWLSYMSMPDTCTKSKHWPIMYKAIKKSGGLSIKQAMYYSYYYSYFGEMGDIEEDILSDRLECMPMNTDFSIDKNRLALKYTPKPGNDSIQTGLILSHIEKMIEGFKKEKSAVTLEIEQIVGSKAWRLGRVATSPARILKRIFRR